MDRYICIHGHFYQPPRENPWLEEIEEQDSAYPFHDWNERITAECYATNAVSRILDHEHRIVRIVNNYARISFNFGPTLMSWLETFAPETYEKILKADRLSQKRFGGHGSALAQVYNHMIMPLANRRDKITQVRWGIRDFEQRFGRKPEGMWLAETAVDSETLEILADHDIGFTILAPTQAARVREIGEKEWTELKDGRIDPSRSYLARLPGGKSIVLFFYDGLISRAVAFDRLLSTGENFVNRLLAGFSPKRTWPQLVNIATDGETYGHHHPHGDMALAWALDYVERNNVARLTNYAQFLELHPPTHEVEIREDSSWSCAHGVERWRGNCGCNSGANPEWTQQWREPLRNALDDLRDELAPVYERTAAKYLKDPWEAREDYIEVILDRSPETIQAFLQRHASTELDQAREVLILKLLELQRHAMLMFTSCGWFFDDVSRIETVQILQYAGRAIQIAQEVFGDHVEERFLERLAEAKSNLPQHQNGRAIYEKSVRPARVDLFKVGAHFSIRSLFEPPTDNNRVSCYDVRLDGHKKYETGRLRMLIGFGEVVSHITRESRPLTLGALSFGDHNVDGWVRDFVSEEDYRRLIEDLDKTFQRADYSDLIRLLDKHFGRSTYSISSLFRDAQRKILKEILHPRILEAEEVYQQLFEKNAPLVNFLSETEVPVPRPFQLAANLVFDSSLRKAIQKLPADLERAMDLLIEAQRLKLTLDAPGLSMEMQKALEAIAGRLLEDPANAGILGDLDAALNLVVYLPAEVDLWKVQNIYHTIQEERLEEMRSTAASRDVQAADWVIRFIELGKKLRVKVE